MEWISTKIKFYDCNQENLNKVYADYIKKVDGDETRCICTNVLCVVPYTQPKINNGRPSEYIKTDYKMMTSTLLISWKDGAETINKKPYIQFNFGNISQSSIVKFARMEDINWDNILNTLEVKEVDLEKEIHDYHITKKPTVWFNTLEDIAKHFFELGLKVHKGE